jgi:hypothetical protein
LKVAQATPRLIDRGDLLAALDHAATRKVTIISAPAGSGKTSLLRAWADRPGQRTCSPGSLIVLGDLRAANQAERALALAESDRLVLPFAMTGSAELLEALPRHHTAHAALLADILDALHGSSPAAKEQSSLPPAEELSPAERRARELRLLVVGRTS